MLHTTYTFLIALLCFPWTVFSQEAPIISVNHQGLPMWSDDHPWLHQFSSDGVSFAKSPTNWVWGTYYDKSNVAHATYVKFHHHYIYTTADTASNDHEQVHAKDMEALVLGADSFIVLDQYQLKDKHKTKPIIVRYLGEINNDHIVQFAKHKSQPSPNWEVVPVVNYYHFIQIKGHSNWVPIGSGGAISFQDYYYSDSLFAPILQMGSSEQIITFINYYFAYKNKTAIGLNAYWNYTAQKTHEKYQLRVDSFAHKNYHVTIYQQGQKSASFHTTNLLNLSFESTQTLYHPNGNKKRELTYVSGKLMMCKEFNVDGISVQEYEIQYLFNPTSYDTLAQIFFPQYANTPNIQLTATPPGSTHQYFQTIENGVLTESYRLEDGIKIYQPLALWKELSAKKISSYLQQKRFTGDELTAFYKAGSTHFFVRVTLSDKGVIQSAQILNPQAPIADQWMINHLNHFIEKEKGNAIKPYRANGDKVYSEFILPIHIHIKYVPPSNNGHYYNPYNMYNSFSPGMAPPNGMY